mgnify:CR=1 FL=1
MIKKSISITEKQEQWLKEQTAESGLSESDILRRLIDERRDEKNQ